MHEFSEVAELRAFVALAESGSFAGASEVLSRHPTVLSRRLQALETRLGVRLAERTTRQLVLTEAGRAYLARIGPLLNDLDAANREAASFVSGEPRGRLKVALPGSFARLWLAPLIVSFLKQYPHITLEADYSNRFVDLIGERYDVAVRLGELQDSRLVARKVGDRRRLICAAPEYLAARPPLSTPEDIMEHVCLCYTGRNDPFRWDFRSLASQSIAVRVKSHIASDDADLLVAAAIGGLGLFYTTDWHVGPELASGRLEEVLTDWPVLDNGAIYVITPATGGTPNKTRAFSDWIAKGLAKRPWCTSA